MHIFSNERLIELVNARLTECGYKTKVQSVLTSDTHSAQFKTTRDGRLFVQFYRPHETAIAIRAIHRIKCKYRRFTFLFNGQGGTNLDTLVLDGESGEGMVWADRGEYFNHVKLLRPDLKTDKEVESCFLKRIRGFEKCNPHFA
ncbi:hypothetical protein [Vibrio mediterranei]|uniref:hypothetical protein n=1 Tax=Vibrio mediterranei TaxID=689 RepID=UPI0040678182